MKGLLNRPKKMTLRKIAEELGVTLWKAMELVTWVRLRIAEDLSFPYEERWKWLIEEAKKENKGGEGGEAKKDQM